MESKIDFNDLYDHSAVSWGEKLTFPSTRGYKQYTHLLFNRYPARSISLVPRAILKSFRDKEISQVRVLDPFMGSGTTAVEACLQDMIPVGVELDSFARLISDVSVWAYTDSEIKRIEDIYLQIEAEWKNTKPNEALSPNLTNIHYWFDTDNFREMLRLKTFLYNLLDNGPVLNFYKVVFADIVRPCSLAERQSLKPYISKKYPKKPAEVWDTFSRGYNKSLIALKEFSTTTTNKHVKIQWLGNNGANFVSNEKDRIDIAITSPPYINALDYVRSIKLESSWIDCGSDQSFSSIKRQHIGEANRAKANVDSAIFETIAPYISKIAKKDKRRSEIVTGYFHDMFGNLQSVHKSLVQNGEYHMIVGNSVIRGVQVPTHELLAKLATKIGFDWTGYYYYDIKDHRTSIPRKGQGGKIKMEHVISLKKKEGNK